MQENDSIETPLETGPTNRIPQNNWAVASASETLLGHVSKSAFLVALALAAHIPFNGKMMRVWPSWKRIMFMSGIGSGHTLKRALEELEQCRFITIARPSRRRSAVYSINFVSRPTYSERKKTRLLDSTDTPLSTAETAPLGESGGKPVEKDSLSTAETAPLSTAVSAVPNTYQSNSINEERIRENGNGERGRHDPPPRIDLKTIDSHPLSSAFEDKSTHVQGAKVEILDPVAEAKRKADYKALWNVSGPVAREHLERVEKERDLLRSRSVQEALGGAEVQLAH